MSWFLRGLVFFLEGGIAVMKFCMTNMKMGTFELPRV